MQSIMEKLPKLPDKKKLVAGAAVVVLAAAGWQLYSSIMHKPQEANYIPIVRTMMIGESIVDSSAVYPGEVRGRYESQLGLSDCRQNRFPSCQRRRPGTRRPDSDDD